MKAEAPGVREARLEQVGAMRNSRAQLMDKYDVELETFGTIAVLPGTQIYIDPDALGSEDQESGIIDLTEQKGIYTPGDYQEGLKYYHPIKGKFYTFQGEKFIPVESAQ